MSAEPPASSVLSHFWTPLTAVGSHGTDGPNAQICVSVFGASIVPERPRLLVNLSKTNLTTELVQVSGTLSITLLSEAQLELLAPLGLRSGRDGDKLQGLAHELTAAGDPLFLGGVGGLACSVIDSHDLGDAVAFLCRVEEERAMAGGAPLTWTQAKQVVGEEFLRAWAEKSERERAAALASMRW